MKATGATSAEISVQVEREFLAHFPRADFIFIVNPDGYTGITVNGEIGYAIARKKPVYALNPLDLAIDDHPVYQGVAKIIKVFSPQDVAKMAQNNRLDTHGYWWCR